jgi:hypothetical protein
MSPDEHYEIAEDIAEMVGMIAESGGAPQASGIFRANAVVDNLWETADGVRNLIAFGQLHATLACAKPEET